MTCQVRHFEENDPEEETHLAYANTLKVSRLGVHTVCIPCELMGVIKKLVPIRLNNGYKYGARVEAS